MPAYPPLPQDIVDAIVKELADDAESLNWCSTASMAFLLACRKYLFRAIAIDFPGDGNGQHSCVRLFNVLINHPELVLHIRELSLSSGHWMFSEPTLPPLLRCIADAGLLQKFTLDAFNTLYWSQLDNALQDSLQRIFRSNKLQTLVICGLVSWDFPPDIVTSSPALKDLSLFIDRAPGIDPTDGSKVDGAGSVDSSSFLLGPPRFLKSLSFSGPHSAKFLGYLTTPTSSIQLSDLRTLQVNSMGEANEKLVWEVMKVAAKSLTHLHLSNRNSSNSDLDVHICRDIRLDVMESLKFVEFRLYPALVHCRWMTEVMQSWGMARSIETIRMVFGPFESRGVAWYFFREVEATMMDSQNHLDENLASLCSRSKVPHLKIIEILIFVVDFSTLTDHRSLNTQLDDWFPRLKETGCLTGGIFDAYSDKYDKALIWD